jgi:hypothetical protein
LSGRWLSRRCRWIPRSWRCCLIEGIGGCGPPTGDGRALGDRVTVGLAPQHPAPWPGCRPLCGAIGPCWRLMGPEADLPADLEFYPRSGGAESRAHIPRQEQRWGGLRIAAVSLSG